MNILFRIPFTAYWLGISNIDYPSKTIVSKKRLWLFVKVFDSSVDTNNGYYWKPIS